MLPKDTNAHGTIFGGVIMSHIDLAGAVASRQHTPRDFVTRAMKEVEFIAPVYVGDIVSLYAEVVREGRTSLTVRVDVEAERFKQPGVFAPVTAAEVTYVAVDAEGKATSIR